MSSPHADDAFAFQFDDAVDAMHHETRRGSRPSAGLWSDIRGQMRVDEQDVSATTAPVNPTSARIWTTDGTEARQSPAAWPPARQSGRVRSPSTWVALGLVLMLVVSGLYLNMQQPPDTDDQQLAWAPGTVTSAIASPDASPTAINYAPEFACNVEPLTTDQVLDMVMNPDRELARRGSTAIISAELDKPRETGGDTLYWRSWFEQPQRYTGDVDPELLGHINDTANQFWNCLMTGTAFQVWALMYPSTVQHEILTQYPVVRDEAMLRAHIEKWGPMRYSASVYHAFPDLGGADPVRVSRHADESFGSTAVLSDPASDDSGSAIVTMVRHPDSGASQLDYQELLLKKAPDGTWWVVAINYPDNLRGRG